MILYLISPLKHETFAAIYFIVFMQNKQWLCVLVNWRVLPCWLCYFSTHWYHEKIRSSLMKIHELFISTPVVIATAYGSCIFLYYLLTSTIWHRTRNKIEILSHLDEQKRHSQYKQKKIYTTSLTRLSMEESLQIHDKF